MNWKTAILNSAFCVIGAERSGKTSIVMATAWRESEYSRKIAVVRQKETDEWPCTHRLPFTEESLEKLTHDIMRHCPEYSVILEFSAYDSSESIKFVARQLCSSLAEISSHQAKCQLLLDAFEYYADSGLAFIGEQTKNIVISGYAYQDISQLSKKCGIEFIPSISTSMFLKTTSIDSAERIVKLFDDVKLTPAELLGAKQGDYHYISNGKFFSGNFQGGKAKKH